MNDITCIGTNYYGRLGNANMFLLWFKPALCFSALVVELLK